MSKRSKIVSRHIQARLSVENVSEYHALATFHEWEDAGYTQKEIIVKALLALGNHPMPTEKGVLSAAALHEALIAAQDRYAEVVAQLIDERFDELAKLAPADRRQRLQETTGLSLRTSVTNSIDVAEYNGEQFEDED